MLAWLLMPVAVAAQGFAGLGTTAEGFSVPKPGHALSFPADHGPHPDFRVEWWYVTANLQDQQGNSYGVQWTLFRSALKPGEAAGWQSPQIWMGHAALTTPSHHFVAERFARGGIGQAGAIATPFAAWIDNWRFAETPSGEGSLIDMRLTAGGADFSYDLGLLAKGPLVLQGDHGYSVKSASGQASYYYSQPFFEVQGTLSVAGRSVAVTGKAWLDREWSSQPLSADQTGWDWFSLHLNDGAKLMAFRLRDGGDGFISGTWIEPDGKTRALSRDALRLTPLEEAEVAGRRIPVKWRVEFPEKGINLVTEPLNPQSWMSTRFPYWEGPIRLSGSHGGVGYLEMTGY
ncbi:lipocalin-like domain-containing protein [Rhizobium paknamense]|nr:lipocalin-like domain-containing protein [Rhizobium paknamense]